MVDNDSVVSEGFSYIRGKEEGHRITSCLPTNREPSAKPVPLGKVVARCAAKRGVNNAGKRSNKQRSWAALTIVLGIILSLLVCCRLVVSSKRAKRPQEKERPGPVDT
jgi:hypothetical protein